tara:strand:- start:5737 stop:5916 length:180 start_codon:yes stop_codon:yes gene_type:complete
MPVGSHDTPKSINRRIDSLWREKDSIARILGQAELSSLREGLESIRSKLESIEDRLSGN